MKLIATQAFPYAGKELKAGDPFDSVSDEDARILKGVGKARDPDTTAPVSQPAAREDGLFERKDERAAGGKKGRAGRYNRTDMRAED